MLSFFLWWYGAGWRQVVAGFGPRLNMVADSFSTRQLLRTLFAPWRRISTTPGRSLDAKMRAWADNAFSRVIGFIVRLIVLLAASISLAGIALLTAIQVVLWPLLPPLVPVCLIAGFLL